MINNLSNLLIELNLNKPLSVIRLGNVVETFGHLINQPIKQKFAKL